MRKCLSLKPNHLDTSEDRAVLELDETAFTQYKAESDEDAVPWADRPEGISRRAVVVNDARNVPGIQWSDGFMDKVRHEIQHGEPIPEHLLEDPQDLPLGEQAKVDSRQAEALIKRLAKIATPQQREGDSPW